MRKSKRPISSEKRFNEIVELFAPFVIQSAIEEIDSLLKKGFTSDRLETCIEFVEGYDTGRLKKAVVLRALKKKQKTVQKGEEVTLSKREYKFLLKIVRAHLPERVVQCWKHAVIHAPNIVSPSAFDDAMLPPGAQLILYQKAFNAFGIDLDSLRKIFCDIRTLKGYMPTPLIEYLEYIGYEDGWK